MHHFAIYKAGRDPTPYWWWACTSCNYLTHWATRALPATKLTKHCLFITYVVLDIKSPIIAHLLCMRTKTSCFQKYRLHLYPFCEWAHVLQSWERKKWKVTFIANFVMFYSISTIDQDTIPKEWFFFCCFSSYFFLFIWQLSWKTVLSFCHIYSFPLPCSTHN